MRLRRRLERKVRKIEVVRVQPGDVLLVEVATDVDEFECAYIRDVLHHAFGDDTPVVVMVNDIQVTLAVKDLVKLNAST